MQSNKTPLNHQGSENPITNISNHSSNSQMQKKLYFENEMNRLAGIYPNLKKRLQETDNYFHKVAIIGCAFFNGVDLPLNEKEAVRWFTEAADNGHAEAQYRLGYCFLSGTGTEVNQKKAFEYYKKGAKKSMGAKVALAECYQKGIGTEKNSIIALGLFEEAATNGDDVAYSRAGWMHENGLGTRVNLKKAAIWYGSLIDKFVNKPETCRLFKFVAVNFACIYSSVAPNYPDLFTVSKNLTPAMSYLKYVAFSEDRSLIPNGLEGNTYYARAICYAEGIGVEIDRNVSRYNLQLAADNNHPRACYKLARMYLSGTNEIAKDMKIACKYFHKAAEQDFTKAYRGLAECYLNAEGGVADDKKAFEFLQKTIEIEGEDPTLLSYLVYYYLTGLGGEKNYFKAFEYANKADNNAFCLNALGYMYENGYAVFTDKITAIHYYQKAYNYGSSDAEKSLIRLRVPLNKQLYPNQGKDKYEAGLKLEQLNQYNEAALCYLDSAKEKYGKALSALGWYLEHGLGGLGKDENQARSFYSAANNLNDPAAIARLEVFKNMSALPRISFDDCTCEVKLGKGAFSSVYKVKLKSTLSNQYDYVAVKHIHKFDETLMRYLNAELTIAQLNINSENIIKVVGACMSPPFIALEVAKYSLEYYIQNNPFNLTMCYKIAKGIANGVACFHQYGFIHRDIKAGNILLDENLVPKLADFDFAMKKTTPPKDRPGTRGYQAPELFDDKYLPSEKSDVYAMGMTFFNMVSGYGPFHDDKSSKEVVRKIKNHVRPAIPIHCPKGFAEIIVRCWRTDPKLRPTALEVKNDIEKLLTP